MAVNVTTVIGRAGAFDAIVGGRTGTFDVLVATFSRCELINFFIYVTLAEWHFDNIRPRWPGRLTHLSMAGRAWTFDDLTCSLGRLGHVR